MSNPELDSQMMGQELRERRDSLSDLQVEGIAGRDLESLGLSLEDLRGKRVVDICSGPSVIERAARNRRMEKVFSVDRWIDVLSRRPEAIGGVNADIRALPFADGSIDLAIVRAASMRLDKSDTTPEMQENSTMLAFAEINRVLTDNGEARVFPAELNFLDWNDKEMIALREERRAIKDPTQGEGLVRRRALDQRMNRRLEQLKAMSTEYLQRRGYAVELIRSQSAERDAGFWIIRKSNLKRE